MRIPADVERPDKLLAGLTARQLAILGVAAVVLWAGYAGHPPVGARRGVRRRRAPGRGCGRHAGPRPVRRRRRRPVGEPRRGATTAPRTASCPPPTACPPRRPSLALSPDPLPDTLRLPFAGVGADGIVDLGVDGLAMICRASAVTFSLRTPAEQEALVAGFARWLNSLDRPAQILVRAEPVDLTPSIDALLDAAPGLPHPALEAAARGHAAFLADLGARRDLLRREVLVVLRQRRQRAAPTPRPGSTVVPPKPPPRSARPG